MSRSDDPLTPWELLSWISGLSDRNTLCVDCGAGTTGTANFLAKMFHRSVALDVNPVLGSSARNVETLMGSANSLPFDTDSVDLLISVQAFHHFDREMHLSEALRVIRPGGAFAALCWGEVQIPDPVQRAYTGVFEAIAPYWETARADVLGGYPGLSFTGQPMALPTTYRCQSVTLDQFEESVATWSALQTALRADIEIPMPEDSDLECIDDVFELRWPLIGKVFKV